VPDPLATFRPASVDVAHDCRDALFACARACGGLGGRTDSHRPGDVAAADACARSAGRCFTTWLLLDGRDEPGAWLAPLEECVLACGECEEACFEAETISRRCVAAAESCRQCAVACVRLVEALRAEGLVEVRVGARPSRPD